MSKKASKLFFLELAMSGFYHSDINSGFIRILKMVFPEVSEIVVKTETKHASACRKILDAELGDIKFLPFYFPKVALKTLIIRDIIGLWHAVITLLRTKKNDILFFSYVLPLTHIVIILLNKLLKRKLFICLHGQMEAFIPTSPLRYTKYYFGLETPLFKMNKYGYYVILGEPIIKEIRFLFSEASKLIIVDHPYNYNNNTAVPDRGGPLRVGQIGVGDLGKGTQVIFDLASRLEDYIKSGDVEFVIIGKLNAGLYKYDNGLVEFFIDPLNEAAFQEQIERLHYTLYFRNSSQGIAVASGSFFDTVKYLKPYISLDNRFIKYYADRFPETGQVAASIEEMVDVIRDRIEERKKNAFSSSNSEKLYGMRNALSLSNIALSFHQQLKLD